MPELKPNISPNSFKEAPLNVTPKGGAGLGAARGEVVMNYQQMVEESLKHSPTGPRRS